MHLHTAPITLTPVSFLPHLCTVCGSYDYSEFAPLIVADKHNPKQLFCKVTGRTLNKIPDQVRKHVASQKYLRKREQYLQEQQARKAAGDVRRAKAAAHAEREKEDEDEEPEFWVSPRCGCC